MHALRTRPQGSEVNKEGEGPAKESGGVAPLVPGDVIAKLMDKPGGQTCQPHCCSEHNGSSCISQEFTRQHWLLGGSVETFIVGVCLFVHVHSLMHSVMAVLNGRWRLLICIFLISHGTTHLVSECDWAGGQKALPLCTSGGMSVARVGTKTGRVFIAPFRVLLLCSYKKIIIPSRGCTAADSQASTNRCIHLSLCDDNQL